MIPDTEFVICRVYPTKGTAGTFLDAVTVWINKPHVANRRLLGTKILRIVTAGSIEVAERLASECTHNDPEAGPTDEEQKHEENVLMEVNLRENACERYVVVQRELLPKQTQKYPSLIESVIYDEKEQSISFYPVKYSYKNMDLEERDVSNEIVHRWTFLSSEDRSNIQLEVDSRAMLAEHLESPQSQITVQWLRDTLTPKIARWSEETNLNTSITSLRLVGVDHYSQVYSTLKNKYGAELVQNWSEKTDPHKFVYEDIAIAAYLLLLWEEDSKRTGVEKKQSFVDLGCGNGLLVYILTQEGHQGLGIDLRRRNIWDTYGPDIKLEERPITPSAENLFPDFDWLIGNHSDELTPWIPVMAARSSYTCNYFVLPCCHHDFNRRFNSKAKGLSQYRTYLSYVAQIGQVCGFQVEEDRLRIPSTKRVCQIGRHRTYNAEEEAVVDQKRQEFIQSRCAAKADSKDTQRRPVLSDVDDDIETHPKTYTQLAQKRQHMLSFDLRQEFEGALIASDTDGDSSSAEVNSKNSDQIAGVWTDNFQTRTGVERVRNCQTVNQATKEKVVQTVFDMVLAADDAFISVAHDGKPWRRGGNIPLSVVAEKLDKATREELKAECGGVQTLLRNHNHIFQVSGGKVQLRDFSADNPWSQRPKAKSRKVDAASCHKTALCWFHDNHPDGCPRCAEHCTFAHGVDELRPRDQRR